jgi:hypothetical protein
MNRWEGNAPEPSSVHEDFSFFYVNKSSVFSMIDSRLSKVISLLMRQPDLPAPGGCRNDDDPSSWEIPIVSLI